MSNTTTPEGHYAERGIPIEESIWQDLLANERRSDIPDFVMDADISHGAFRLYVLLESFYIFAHPGAFFCQPSRKQLADQLRVSIRTLDRYTKELVDLGALVVEPRIAKDGGHMANAYGVCYDSLKDEDSSFGRRK